MERAEAYRKVCTIELKLYLAKSDFIMVCERPTHISRINVGRLFSDMRKSIDYSDGWGLYHLNGVLFSRNFYGKKSYQRKMPFKDIMAIYVRDQRTQA